MPSSLPSTEELVQRIHELHLTHTNNTPAAISSAPATWPLFGEHTDSAGGVVLMHATQHRTLVAFSPRNDNQVVAHTYNTAGEPQEQSAHSLDQTDTQSAAQHSTQEAPSSAYRIARILTTMIQRQLLSRATHGVDVTVLSTIPVGMGLGEHTAFDVAVALCLAHDHEGIDTPPVHAKLSEVCFQATQGLEPDTLRARYLGAIRGVASHCNIVDYRDGSITQCPSAVDTAEFEVALVAAPQQTQATRQQEQSERTTALQQYNDFLQQAEKAFAVECLMTLPDASQRVIEWLQAVHQFHGSSDSISAPAAKQWLDFLDLEDQRTQLAVQHLRARRHGDLVGVLKDSQRQLATIEALVGVDAHIAELLLNRGALAARSIDAGRSTAVLCIAPGQDMLNLLADLQADGFQTVVLKDGSPAQLH